MIVLVIEDDPVNGSSISELLRRRGHLVEWAADARAATAKLSVIRPDVVLLDWQLPDVDGRTMVSVLSARQLSVVVLTALSEAEIAVLSAEHPGVPFLRKPFDPPEVIRVLERAGG